MHCREFISLISLLMIQCGNNSLFQFQQEILVYDAWTNAPVQSGSVKQWLDLKPAGPTSPSCSDPPAAEMLVDDGVVYDWVGAVEFENPGCEDECRIAEADLDVGCEVDCFGGETNGEVECTWEYFDPAVNVNGGCEMTDGSLDDGSYVEVECLDTNMEADCVYYYIDGEMYVAIGCENDCGESGEYASFGCENEHDEFEENIWGLDVGMIDS